MIAVIRVRGKVNVEIKIEDALRGLRLYAKNNCVIIEETPSNMGTLKAVKDYVTWGNISDDMLKTLGKGKKFRLAPQVGGYKGRGMKHAFPKGVLGKRADISDTIKKMLK